MQVKPEYREKYQVIYADPGWAYGSRGARGGWMGELDYTTSTIGALKELPVNGLAPKDAVLFMWTTASFMDQAILLGQAWGFRFIRVDKVWAKTKKSGKVHGVPGPWGFTDAEFIILFARGKMCSHQAVKNQKTVVWEEPYPGTHSEKPDCFRDMIKERFPDMKKIEMFSRTISDGWDSWGDQAVIGEDLFEPDLLSFLD